MSFNKDFNVFAASDWFDVNFFGEFFNSTNDFKIFLSTQGYYLKDETLSSRVLNNWYETGIIDDDRPDGKGWKKFCFTELVWIRVVSKLRKFGMDLKRIKKAKDYLNRFNKPNSISKCELLDFYIMVCIHTKIPVKVVVFESGEADIVRQVDLDIANSLENLPEDFIQIDLNKLLDSMLKEKDVKADYINPGRNVTSNLMEYLESSMSSNDLQSISIRIKDKEYIVDEEFFIKDKTRAIALMSILKFGKLIENKAAGKSNFQVINRKKIKKE